MLKSPPILKFSRRRSPAVEPLQTTVSLSEDLSLLDVIREACARNYRYTLTASCGSARFLILVDRGGPFNVSGNGLTAAAALRACASMRNGECVVDTGWPVEQPLFQVGLDVAMQGLITGLSVETELPAARGVEAMRPGGGAGSAEVGTLLPPTPATARAAVTDPRPAELPEVQASSAPSPVTPAAGGAFGSPAMSAVPAPTPYTRTVMAPAVERAPLRAAAPAMVPPPSKAAAPAQAAPTTTTQSAPTSTAPAPIAAPAAIAPPAASPSPSLMTEYGALRQRAEQAGAGATIERPAPATARVRPADFRPIPVTPPPAERSRAIRMPLDLDRHASAAQGPIKHLLTQAILWLLSVENAPSYTLSDALAMLVEAVGDLRRYFAAMIHRHVGRRLQRIREDWQRSGQQAAIQRRKSLSRR